MLNPNTRVYTAIEEKSYKLFTTLKHANLPMIFCAKCQLQRQKLKCEGNMVVQLSK